MSATPPQRPDPESPASADEKRARGEQRLRSRRAVIRRICVRIALGSVCLFLVCWLTIFGVLVEGKDPALSAKAHHNEAQLSSALKSTTTSTEAAASNTTASETASSAESEAASENPESASRSSESSATPMTTSQS